MSGVVGSGPTGGGESMKRKGFLAEQIIVILRVRETRAKLADTKCFSG